MNSFLRLLAVSSCALLLVACGDDDDESSACASSFDLPGDEFFPEGVAALADGTVFVGSVTSGAIVRTPAPCEGEVTTFVAPPEPVMSAVGLRADEPRGVLWACRSVLDGSLPARLDGHDLGSGALVASHEFPGASCNDIAVDAAGNLYATDPIAHEIVFIAADQAMSNEPAETWLADPAFRVPDGQFSVNGLVFDPDGTLYVGNYGAGELYRIALEEDGSPGPVELVAVDGAALSGPDGIQWLDGGLLIVENTAGTVSRFAVEDGGTVSRTVLAEGLDFPATAAATADGVWVCEAQTDHLLGIDPDPPATPFRVVRVPLQGPL
jgi:sugar lactone lactonase YvrE